MLEPGRDGGRLACRAVRARVALALEHPDLRHDVGPALPGDVSPVAGTVVREAHRHHAVPAAGRVLVD